MTDAQREVLEAFVMSSQHKVLNELQERQLDAIDAALKEIARREQQHGAVVVEAATRLATLREEHDRLTGAFEAAREWKKKAMDRAHEIARLEQSLRSVRERKDERIVELVQQLTETRLALGDANAEIARLKTRAETAEARIVYLIGEKARLDEGIAKVLDEVAEHDSWIAREVAERLDASWEAK